MKPKKRRFKWGNGSTFEFIEGEWLEIDNQDCPLKTDLKEITFHNTEDFYGKVKNLKKYNKLTDKEIEKLTKL